MIREDFWESKMKHSKVDWVAAGKKAWKTRKYREAARKAVLRRKHNDAYLRNIANCIDSAKLHVSNERILKTLKKITKSLAE